MITLPRFGMKLLREREAHMMRHIVIITALLLFAAGVLNAQQTPACGTNQPPTLPATCPSPSANHYRAVPLGSRNSLEAFLGAAYDFKTHLEITQSGQSDIGLGASYSTKPFTTPFYYDVRYGRWNKEGTHGWEIELLHHKLYLDNNPPEVQHFEITHGYNFLMYNNAHTNYGAIWRIGGGPIITHTESTVRGLVHETDYQLAGAGIQFSVGKRWYFSRQFYGALEGKLTGAYARVSVANGRANVPNVAIHGLFGIGYAF